MATTAFGCDLFARLRDKSGNLFFSPLSIETALAMTSGGARGQTLAEIHARDEESAAEAAKQYLQGHDPEDALVSPLKGDLSNYPPTLILASADECLVGDALAFQAALTEARRAVETHIVPAMTHVWPVIAPALPESQAALAAIGNFVRPG